MEIKAGSVKRLLKRITRMRVSKNGSEVMAEAVTAYAEQIGFMSGQNAMHAGRTTIQEEDVILSLSQLQK